MAQDHDYPPPETLAQAVAEVVREKMGARGWTITRLAKESGIDYQNLSRWLLPAKREFGVTHIHRVAVAYGMTASQLYAEAEAKLADALYRKHHPDE